MNNWLPSQKYFFFTFFSVLSRHFVIGSFFFTFHIVWFGSKTCLSYGTVLVLFYIEGFKWCSFILGVLPSPPPPPPNCWNCSTNPWKVWDGYVRACMYTLMCTHTVSPRYNATLTYRLWKCVKNFLFYRTLIYCHPWWWTVVVCWGLTLNVCACVSVCLSCGIHISSGDEDRSIEAWRWFYSDYGNAMCETESV